MLQNLLYKCLPTAHLGASLSHSFNPLGPGSSLQKAPSLMYFCREQLLDAIMGQCVFVLTLFYI